MPDASSLVTPEDYLPVTGDGSQEQSTVQAALDSALGIAQDILGRQLVKGDYVEILKVYQDGKIYPSATPITSIASPNVDGIVIQGAGVYIGYYDPTPVVADQGWLAGIPPQVTVSYNGGFTAATLPEKLKRALCRIAFNSLHPSPLVGVPANANAVHVGDVGFSASGPLHTLDPVDDGIRRDLSSYRNPRFCGWAQLVSGPA